MFYGPFRKNIFKMLKTTRKKKHQALELLQQVNSCMNRVALRVSDM